jgi:hypothetical protein
MSDILAATFNSLTLVLLSVLSLWQLTGRPKRAHRAIKRILWALLPVCVILGLFFQITAAIHKQTYNHDLILHYEDKFDEKMVQQRSLAAKAVTEYLKTRNWNSVTNKEYLDNLETVLGLFDELGFYWQSGDISATVIHEHFYSDIRTYCQESVNYMHAEQKRESSADWEYVEPLFNEVTKIEAKRTGTTIAQCVWDTNSLKEYLDAEIRVK